MLRGRFLAIPWCASTRFGMTVSNALPTQIWIDPAMMLSEYLKPALAVVAVVVLGGGYYWIEHRSHAEEKETPGNALVIVAKSTQACFSDMVRVTGFVVPRREAVVGVDQEGSKVSDFWSAKAKWSPKIRNWPD